MIERTLWYLIVRDESMRSDVVDGFKKFFGVVPDRVYFQNGAWWLGVDQTIATIVDGYEHDVIIRGKVTEAVQ